MRLPVSRERGKVALDEDMVDDLAKATHAVNVVLYPQSDGEFAPSDYMYWNVIADTLDKKYPGISGEE